MPARVLVGRSEAGAGPGRSEGPAGRPEPLRLPSSRGQPGAAVSRYSPGAADRLQLTGNLLRAGPKLADSERVRYVENIEEKLKLSRGHHDDHFEPTGRRTLHDGLALIVFAYTGFTCVAE